MPRPSLSGLVRCERDERILEVCARDFEVGHLDAPPEQLAQNNLWLVRQELHSVVLKRRGAYWQALEVFLQQSGRREAHSLAPPLGLDFLTPLPRATHTTTH